MGRKKKIHLDENGNPCKYWQTPEAIAKRQTPEAKEQKRIADKIRNEKPEAKEQKRIADKIRNKKPEVKAKKRAEYQRRS